MTTTKEKNIPVFIIRNPTKVQLALFQYFSQINQQILTSKFHEIKHKNFETYGKIEGHKDLTTYDEYYIYYTNSESIYKLIIDRIPILLREIRSIHKDTYFEGYCRNNGIILPETSQVVKEANLAEIGWFDVNGNIIPLGYRPFIKVENTSPQLYEKLSNSVAEFLAEKDLFTLVVDERPDGAMFYLSYNPDKKLSLYENANEISFAFTIALTQAEQNDFADNIVMYDTIGNVGKQTDEWLLRHRQQEKRKFQGLDEQPLMQILPEYKQVLKSAEIGDYTPLFIVKDTTINDVRGLKTTVRDMIRRTSKKAKAEEFTIKTTQFGGVEYTILLSADSEVCDYLLEHSPTLIGWGKENGQFNIEKIPFVITKKGKCIESDLMPLCSFSRINNTNEQIKNAVSLMKDKEQSGYRLATYDSGRIVTCYLKNDIREKGNHRDWDSLKTQKIKFLSALNQIEIKPTYLDDFGQATDKYYSKQKRTTQSHQTR